MSMHEIEDLVHLSVVALDRHYPAEDGRVRDWLVALYEFQRRFDCSHTQGRVEEILIRRKHTYHAEPPREVKLIDLAVAVAVAAEAQGDSDLIAGWYELGYQTLVGGVVFSVDELAEMPAVATLREIVARTGYRPSDEERDDELEAWWYAVSVSA
ncbi:hypothetical protein [Paractinoplanes atraurantiacus]|uniref:Uncharacterized protein n=1 Tax=Paractinoplanes atraurantiacus TaxID=1036182 RepID=A0A285EXM3_9ACTN|nr:hypothetical protein [Actinoplanes atraurantiacus]SNY03795.1 hypothetical protein SAMN05421748_10132 [Actinoplanes atraurantiacus]